jgi:Right handed beta helix region
MTQLLVSALRTKFVRCLGLSGVALVVASNAAAIAPSTAVAVSRAPQFCDRVAAPNGDDRNPGTARAPFASVSRLVEALGPGRTGCLRQGRFAEDVRIVRGGRQGKPITLRAAPGAKATICGYIAFKPTADYWRLSRVYVDGSCSSQNTIQIFANRVSLTHDDITNRRQSESCLYIGSDIYGISSKAVVDHNRIHDCGNDTTFTHGIYADAPRNARITDNHIYANAGFGIQLYPDAQGTLFEHNVVDGNVGKSGLLFSGEAPYASSHNVVVHNIFSSNGAYGVSSWWGGGTGVANVAKSNCFWRNAEGAFDSDRVGYRLVSNIRTDPKFIAPKIHDYRLRRGSRCRMMAPRGHVGP